MIHKEIKLRAPEPEDLDLLYSWENDQEIWHLSNTLTPFSKYTLRQYIENSGKSIFESGQLRLMIEKKSGGSTVGTVDLFDFDPFHLRAGIGILIADKGSRRKGYATMAVELMIDYSFNRLKLHQLYCNILSENIESIRLFTRLGFIQVGIKKDWVRSGEGYKDELVFQLLSSTGEHQK